MKIELTNKTDVFIGVIIYLLFSFVLPYAGYVFISPTLSLNLFFIKITGYTSWLVLWHYTWFMVDMILKFPTYNFLIDCVKFLLCKQCPIRKK
jgi:hypothetical protein